MGEYIEKVLAGDPDPKCVLCGGIVKSDAILFEQTLEPAVINRAFEEAAACDLLFAVGSTLKVIPANEVVTQARAGGAKVIIVNGESTAMDSEAHLVIRGRITPTLTAIVAAARGIPTKSVGFSPWRHSATFSPRPSPRSPR